MKKRMLVLLSMLIIFISTVLSQTPKYAYVDENCNAFLSDYTQDYDIDDNCEIAEVIQIPPPNEPVQTNIEVEIRATDISGNVTSVFFWVAIIDTISPTVVPTGEIIPPPVDTSDNVEVYWELNLDNRDVEDPYTMEHIQTDWLWETHYPEGRSSYVSGDIVEWTNIQIIDGVKVMGHRYIAGNYGVGSEWDNPTDGTGINMFSVTHSSGGFTEIYLTYKIKFKKGFDFRIGGKLPGMAAIPSGTAGRPPEPDEGFHARMMWREDGDAMMYSYFHRDYDYQYGEAYGLGHVFDEDIWYDVTQRFVLSNVNTNDGIQEVFIDGILRGSWTGNMMREKSGIFINANAWSSFMGGNTPSFAPLVDGEIFFTGIRLWFPKGEATPEHPQGNTPSPSGRDINEFLDPKPI